MIHSRNALLAVNVLLVIVGVPFFLVRTPRNLLLQSVKASLVILGAYAGVFVMMRMPLAGVPPALTAWLPAITILPLALWQLDRVET
jgi:lipopolysaccharide export LptBFGC system permease protein LptF